MNEVFACFDLDFGPVAWEVARGLIAPAGRIGESGSKPISSWLLSRIQSSQGHCKTPLALEWRLELSRRNVASDKVSRLEGFFAFEDLETANRYARDYGAGRTCKLKLLDPENTKISRGDLRWKEVA